MRAITVREPWASAIADGAKTVENRSSGFTKTYRGPVAIHTSKRISDRGTEDPRIRALYPHGLPTHICLGAVIAVAEIATAHPAAGCCEPWGEETYLNASGKIETDVTHLVLEDIRRLRRPIFTRGSLGLWRPPEDLALEIELALTEEN